VSEGVLPFASLVLVPEGALVASAMRGDRVDTFPSLRTRLRQHLAPSVELADPIAVRLVLSEVIVPLALADPWLGPIARRGGPAWVSVVDAVDEAISVLRERGDALPVVARGEDATAMRAAFLSRALVSLDRELERVGLVDPRREAEVAADAVASADAEDVMLAAGARELLARGIVDWSLPDLALFRVVDAALSRRGGRATIELPVFDRALDAERERDPLDTLIDAVASALDDAPMTAPISEALGDLRLAGSPAPRVPVEVRKAADADTQASAIADAVHEALAAGASPSEVVIAWVSSDDAGARTVLRALEEASIAVSDQRPDRTLRSGLVALARGSLELPGRPVVRIEVGRLLRSSYVDAGKVAETGDAVAARRILRALARALEETRTVLAAGTVGVLEGTTLASTTVSGEKRWRLALIARGLDVLLAQLSVGRTRGDHIRSVRALWAHLGLGRDVADAPHASLAGDAALSSVASAELAAVGRDAEAWASLEEGLAALERATLRLGCADAPATLESFGHELAWSLTRRGARANAATGMVRMVSFRELSPEPTALLVVADADQDSWPEGRLRARLVMPALEERLSEASDPALRPMTQAGSATALARLALAADQARRVVFTVRMRDAVGTPIAPAPVVEWLGRPARSGLVMTSVWQPRPVPARPLSQRGAVLAALWSDPAQGAALRPDVWRRALLERRREEAFGTQLRETHPLVATLPRGAAFVRALTEETGGGERPMPATGIDRMASCVFRGFVAEVVRTRRHAPANDIADAREGGVIVHAALAEAFRATARLWPVRPRDASEIRREGLLAADRVLARERTGTRLGRAAADQARAAVEAVLEWSLADEAWDFAFAEQGVGEEGGWGELVLERGGTRVRLRGRIDRVDLAHASPGARVIDYKRTETTAEDHTSLFGGTKFQLALYGRAVEIATGSRALEGIYLPTQRLRPSANPRVPPLRWSREHEKVGALDQYEVSVLDLVDAVRQGRIEVRPHAAASCTHCDLPGVCRKPRFAPTVTESDKGPTDEGGADA
jgi:RecB family exonuclease